MIDAIKELLNSTEATITPSQAAKVMHCSPYRFNVLFKLGQLPFPAMLSGNRLKIMRISQVPWIRIRRRRT